MRDVWLGFWLGVLHWWLFRISVICLAPGSRIGARIFAPLAFGRYWITGLVGLFLVTHRRVSGTNLGLGLLAATALFLVLQSGLSVASVQKMEKKVSL